MPLQFGGNIISYGKGVDRYAGFGWLRLNVYVHNTVPDQGAGIEARQDTLFQ